MNRKTLISLIGCFMSAAAFAEGEIMNNAALTESCNISYLGVTSGTTAMVPHFELSTYVCDPGYYLPADGINCVICPNNNYCTGGAFQYNAQAAQGIRECPNSWYSPRGMHELASCGRILHIGDQYVYLRTVKKTTPSLNFDIDNDGTPDFFANMTQADIAMNNQTARKLKIEDATSHVTYSVYDDSIDAPVEQEEEEQEEEQGSGNE